MPLLMSLPLTLSRSNSPGFFTLLPAEFCLKFTDPVAPPMLLAFIIAQSRINNYTGSADNVILSKFPDHDVAIGMVCKKNLFLNIFKQF